MTSYAARFRYIPHDAAAGSLDQDRMVEEVGTLLEEVRRSLVGAEG